MPDPSYPVYKYGTIMAERCSLPFLSEKRTAGCPTSTK